MRNLFVVLAFFCCLFTKGVAGKATAASTTKKSSAIAETRAYEKITTRSLLQGKVAGVKFRADVDYLGPHRTEKLDVYLPATHKRGKNRPAIVMIHGGGWTGGSKDARRELEMGTAYARAGYVAISVEYNKKREHLWPVNVYDCKNAVRWVRANAHELDVDPDRIGVIGGSAGGHLALMVAYTADVAELEPDGPYPGIRDDVQACVDLYGIADLKSRRVRSKHAGAVGKTWGEQLLNDEQEKNSALWQLGSPIDHVTSSSPPTMIIHGDADQTVDLEQSQALAKKLKSAGVDCRFIKLPGVPHAVTLNDKRVPRDLRPEVIAFFDKYLKTQD